MFEQHAALPSREQIMKWWYQWRTYIAEGGVSSYPRDAFESLLDTYDEALAAKPAGVPREAIAMVQDCIAARDYDEAAERLRAMYDAAPQSTARDDVIDAKLFDDWHEDIGPVLWVSFPIEEAPWCGTPLYSDWPSYHTHWIPLPDCNRIRALTSNDGA